MTKPMRWSEDGSGASELERAVLCCEQDVEPPVAASAAVWAKLSAELGLPMALSGVAAVEAVSQTAKAQLTAEAAAQAGGAMGSSSPGGVALEAPSGGVSGSAGITVGVGPVASGATVVTPPEERGL